MMTPVIWDHCSGCGAFKPQELVLYVDGFNSPFAVCELAYPRTQPTVGNTRCIIDYFQKLKTNKEKVKQ